MSSSRAIIYFSIFVAGFAVISSATPGPVPINGSLEITTMGIPGMAFSVEPDSVYTVYVYPYATMSYALGYSGNGAGYNLVQGRFIGGDYEVTNAGYGSVEGDLAIRIYNLSGFEITLDETVITLGLNIGSTDVYLPGFSLAGSVGMHFWVADDGSSYYANVTSEGIGISGGPTMSAAESIADGYIAAGVVPEPATMLLFGVGMLFLPRKKR